MPRAAILVLTQCPDRGSAQLLARVLVEARLAACVSIGTTVESLYHWHGKIEMAEEVPVVIKTCAEAYPAVEAAVRAHHPYELPEIVAVPIVHGLSSYLAWIDDETRPAAAGRG